MDYDNGPIHCAIHPKQSRVVLRLLPHTMAAGSGKGRN